MVVRCLIQIQSSVEEKVPGLILFTFEGQTVAKVPGVKAYQSTEYPNEGVICNVLPLWEMRDTKCSMLAVAQGLLWLLQVLVFPDAPQTRVQLLLLMELWTFTCYCTHLMLLGVIAGCRFEENRCSLFWKDQVLLLQFNHDKSKDLWIQARQCRSVVGVDCLFLPACLSWKSLSTALQGMGAGSPKQLWVSD